jgi:hypothetical protein
MNGTDRHPTVFEIIGGTAFGVIAMGMTGLFIVIGVMIGLAFVGSVIGVLMYACKVMYDIVCVV